MPEDKNPNWGGARPGAGRPKRKYTLSLTADQAVMLMDAMDSYSAESFSTDASYDPEPLETLLALVNGLYQRSRVDEDEPEASTPL